MSVQIDLSNNSAALILLEANLVQLGEVSSIVSQVLDFKNRDSDPVSFNQGIYSKGIISEYSGQILSFDVQHSDNSSSGFSSVPSDLIENLPSVPLDFSRSQDPDANGIYFKFRLLYGHKRFVRIVITYDITGDGESWIDELDNVWVDEFDNVWITDDFTDPVTPVIDSIVYYQPYILPPYNIIQP